MADNLLHVVVPVLYVLYWYRSVPKGSVKWRDSLYWVAFPLVYLIYSLIRGPLVGWYPYPFLNIGELGYTKVLLNSGFVLLAFLITGMVLIGIKQPPKKKPLAISHPSILAPLNWYVQHFAMMNTVLQLAGKLVRVNTNHGGTGVERYLNTTCNGSFPFSSLSIS